jgi:hypothetical protein
MQGHDGFLSGDRQIGAGSRKDKPLARRRAVGIQIALEFIKLFFCLADLFRVVAGFLDKPPLEIDDGRRILGTNEGTAIRGAGVLFR